MIKVESNTKKSAGDVSRVQSCAEVFDNIMGSVREPLVVLDAELKVVKANQAFYQAFAIKPDETEGMLIYDLGHHQWNIPELRRLLEEILPEHAECNDFEVNKGTVIVVWRLLADTLVTVSWEIREGSQLCST